MMFFCARRESRFCRGLAKVFCRKFVKSRTYFQFVKFSKIARFAPTLFISSNIDIPVLWDSKSGRLI
jgi:hypothetical protein